MLIAQISDLHIRREGELACGVVDTAACLARAIAHLGGLKPEPDLVLLTGDLADSGAAEEYEHLRRLLAPLAMPYYLIPGNHDDRRALRSVFNDHAYLHEHPDFAQYVISGYPLRIIMLDTLDSGNDAGLMDEPRLAWLEARLEEARTQPTIVVMHHPPFETGIVYMDRINCRGADKMEAIIRRHPQVERVLCGHVHRAIQTRWAGTAACIAPSCAHQLTLDLREDDMSPGEYILEPGGFMLHLWRPGTGLVTHTGVIGKYEGPYRFEQ